MAKQYDIADTRVVGFAGHAGAGKTTICEAILFNTKANDRIGSVENGSSVMDFEAEEEKRQYSVSTSFFDVDYKGKHLFLVDTPGNSNFIPEGQTILQTLGSVILPVDGVEGVKYQTEVLAGQIKEKGLPHIAVISRLDKEHSDFDKAFASITESFPVEPVAIQLPIGKEEGLNGVVDLLANKAYTYADASGKAKEGDIPAELADKAEELRGVMIERLVESDDDIMMKYLDGEEVTEEELYSCLKKGTIAGNFCPVLVASAVKNVGIDLLCKVIVDALPNPTEEAPKKTITPSSGEEGELSISADGNFVAQVIKTLSDPFAGKVNILRVFRGSLSGDQQFFNIGKRSKEKPGKWFYQRGKEHEQIDAAKAGEIIAVIKLKELNTGDTIVTEEKDDIQMAELATVPPMVHFAVLPKKQGEEDKMGAAIQRILEEDVNLKFWRQEQTKQFILSGIGQAQIDVAAERMNRKFGVEVQFSAPKVPYRETIKGKADVQGKFKKQSGGRGQYGDCHIRVAPNPGKGFEFIDAIVGGVIPRQFIPAVEKGIVEAMVSGELTGNPVQDVQVELHFGSYHTVDSSEMAFKVAGSMAWKKAMMEAKPVLLEPIHKVEITVPSDYMGDVYGNISSRRGKVQGSEDKAKQTTIISEIPEDEMHTLAADLRAMTGDRAAFVSRFDHYEEVPPAIADKIIEAFQKAKEEA